VRRLRGSGQQGALRPEEGLSEAVAERRLRGLNAVVIPPGIRGAEPGRRPVGTAEQVPTALNARPAEGDGFRRGHTAPAPATAILTAGRADDGCRTGNADMA